MDNEIFGIFKDSSVIAMLLYIVFQLKKALENNDKLLKDSYEKRIDDFREETKTLEDYASKSGKSN